MAKKITDLTALSTIEEDDLFVVYEDSSGITKKITSPNILGGATAAEVGAVCDGNTATAAEITAVCDGNTATAAEITAICDADSNNPPITGDATVGRVFRIGKITIASGTGDTITCNVDSVWNGDTITGQSDISGLGTPKGAYTYYALDGQRHSNVIVDGTEFSGTPVAAFGVVSYNSADCDMIVEASISADSIKFQIMDAHSVAADWELDENLSTGFIEIDFVYITAS